MLIFEKNYPHIEYFVYLCSHITSTIRYGKRNEPTESAVDRYQMPQTDGWQNNWTKMKHHSPDGVPYYPTNS